MRFAKSILLASVAAFCIGCSPKVEYKLVSPLPTGLDVNNLQDCCVPAFFRIEDFNWIDGNLEMTVYSKDLYDAVDISMLHAGDTVIYDSEKIVVNKLVDTDYGLEINDGLENGGCLLAGFEGGTYVARSMDDHATYTKLGRVSIPLAEDFVIMDCGMFPEDPIDTIRTGQRDYIENLNGIQPDFFQLNTLVTIESGVITEISRRWIP